MKKTQKIVEETQRESIINRPHNLAGSIKPISKERFNISDNEIVYGKSSVVPALLKVFMEALDNPIDIAIKGGCDKIDIKIDSNSIEVKDNGYGIDTTDHDGETDVFKAFCKYNTSTNYGENRGQGQKGVNGIGVKLCTTLSTKFEAVVEDKNGKIKLTSADNNLNHKMSTLKPTGKTGVQIKFYPDFNIFAGETIDDVHITRMYEYVLLQSLTYPNIKFTFNGKMVKYTPKKFISMFNENHVVESYEDFFVAVVPNETDDFKQISYVNGLETSKGGTHVDYITDGIVSKLKDKIIKKYKSIKPGDIKNKLTIVVIAKDVKEIDWDGQTKESITTPKKYFSEYFSEIDFAKLADKVHKCSAIIDPIVDYFKIKEEFKKKQEMAKLGKTKKKIKSDKYTKAVGSNKILVICEGASAKGGLMPILGRDGIAFFEMKGKPLNAYTATQAKFSANKELTELYQIIKNEDFDYVVTGTDQDLDGIHIASLLIGFYKKYLPEDLAAGKLGRLQTPVFFTRGRDKKPKEWFYNVRDIPAEKGEYMKGLGSFEPQDLDYIMLKDGIEKMIDIFDDTSSETIEEWIGDDSAPRKKYIMANDFDLIKI